jgi:hypothetical protein
MMPTTAPLSPFLLSPRRLRDAFLAGTCAVLLITASAWAKDSESASGHDQMHATVETHEQTGEQIPEVGRDQAKAVAATDASDQAAIPDDIDWSLLNTEVGPLPGKTPKARNAAGKSADSHADWKYASHDDGSSAVSVKRSLFPFWDTKVGVDMTVASSPATTSYEALNRKLEGLDPYARSSGSAWAGMTAPGVGTIWDKTTIEARINPSTDQTTFGTAISKSLPFGGDQYSLSMQSGYNFTQQGHTALAGLTGGTSNLAIDNSAKLNFPGTGTSLIAGQTLSTTDDRWLGHVGAEQKLFGGVSITGSISETAEGYAERSLKAGYKYRW